MTDPDGYFPSLEAARSAPRAEIGEEIANWLYLEPVESYSLAAILIVGRVLRRTSFRRAEEMSEAQYERTRQSQPDGVPDTAKEMKRRMFARIVPDLPAAKRRCMNCLLRPGQIRCMACLGMGCSGCDDGCLPCPTCDGTLTSMAAVVEYVNDDPVETRQLLLPAMPQELKQFVRGVLAGDTNPPAALETDLDGRSSGDAYRGRGAEPAFHGFRYNDALPRAKKALDWLQRLPSVLRREANTYAWPIYCATFSRGAGDVRDIAVIVDPGKRVLVCGAERRVVHDDP